MGTLPFGLYSTTDIDSSIVYNPTTGDFSTYVSDGQRLIFGPKKKFPVISFPIDHKRLIKDELFISSDKGVMGLDITTGKIKDHFLPDNKIGTVMLAKDGSFWCGSIGNGIFRLLKTPVSSVKTMLTHPSVIYIKGTSKGMYCTTDNANLINISFKNTNTLQDPKAESIFINRSHRDYSHYLFLGKNKVNQWIGCSGEITLKDKLGGKELKKYYIHTKAVLEEDSSHLLIGAISGIFRLNKETFSIEDTFLYNQRVVALTKVKEIMYAGTLNGLIKCYPNKSSTHILPYNQHLNKHVIALCTGRDGKVWMANSSAELVILQGDTISNVVDLKKGLQCNRISCVEASDSLIWIGTDNGVFAVSQWPPYIITKHISFAMGLNSNEVNCINIYKKRIWVGSIDGINYFDENDVSKNDQKANIVINSITNGNDFILPSINPVKLKNKPLAIDFDVVDFSGGLKPFFQYRINDESDWTTLEGSQLYFPSAPYGTFNLTIRALSPTWIDGATFSQTFYNPAPFYKTFWFFWLLFFCGSLIISFVAVMIVKQARKRDKTKLAVQRNLLRLEQMALQGQLNPHFIFNCIAAIKQYYSSGNLEKADGLVDSFSLLIRRTFEMGIETFIFLDKELSYLSEYLNVELARFNDSFTYQIEKDIKSAEWQIPVPAMLLQPIVENAIRHGIRHLPDGTGKIKISVSQQNDQVEITITDNGIGRTKSQQLQAQGFLRPLTSSNVNEKRINILNRLFDSKISMQITDAFNELNQVAGTTVFISYPINLNELLKDEGNNY